VEWFLFMGFLKPNDRLQISTLNGWSDFILLAPLEFMWHTRMLRVRVGASTDGLSSPKFVKCDLQSTNSFFPAVAHDGFYRGYIDESFDGGVTWKPWTLEQYVKADADCALAELCEDNFVPPYEATAIYQAVHEFGQSAWDQDAVLRSANCKTT
jgi:hypothetical protein